jgi:hypothetical protein
MLNGFLSPTKRSSSMNQSPPPLPFFGLGVTEETAKPEFFLAIGDDASSASSCLKTMKHTPLNEVGIVSK